MTYSEAISKRIYNLIRDKEITINRLATLSKLKQSTVDNIVKCNTKNPGIKSLHRIAQGLQITISELLDFPDMNNEEFEDD